MRVAAGFLDRAAQDPARVAVTCAERSFSYGELAASTRAIASWLRERVPAGRCIGLFLPSGADFLAWFLGATEAGLAVATFHTGWSAQEASAAIDDTAPALIVTGDEHLSVLRRAGAAAPLVVLCPDGTDATLAQASPAAPDAGSRQLPPGSFYVGFTSGSTGRPKGFVRGHRSWCLSFEACAPFGIDPASEVAAPGGLDHSLFLFAALHALHEGAGVHLQPRFAPGGLLDLIGRHAITHVYGVPTMIVGLLDAASVDRSYPTVTRVISSGAPWPRWLLDALTGRFPAARAIDFYGSSELSFVSWRTVTDGELVGSLGRPFPGVEIQIRDADGTPVAAGEPGLLWVRSPLTFDSYLRPDHPAAVRDRDGWITAGDVVRRPTGGPIQLVGRADTMIVTGGRNVYPEQVERVLGEQPEVAEAVVVAAPDRAHGQLLCAVVRPTPGAHLTRRLLRSRLQPALGAGARPQRWYLVDHLPRASSGKPARGEVAEMVRTGQLDDRELRR